MAVCEASERVFRHFAADPEVARRRYRVVRQVPALREREIVTVFRYERLFDDYLRASVPGLDPLDAVGFAALVTAVHNHVLRRAAARQPGAARPCCAPPSTTCCAATACIPTGPAPRTTTSSSRSSRDGCRRPRSRDGCATASTDAEDHPAPPEVIPRPAVCSGIS